MGHRWFDRTFNFTMPAELFPNVVERLRGIPARVEEKVVKLSPGVLARRDGDEWSIQEHLGHLLDLEELHLGGSTTSSPARETCGLLIWKTARLTWQTTTSVPSKIGRGISDKVGKSM